MSMCVWNRRQILREILEEKARHKRQAEADALAKREEIASKAPVYASLERELALIRMELSPPGPGPSGAGEQRGAGRGGQAQGVRPAGPGAGRAGTGGLYPGGPKAQISMPALPGHGQRVGGAGRPLPLRAAGAAQAHLCPHGANGQSFESFDLSLFPDEASGAGPSQRRRMEQAREYGQLYAGRFPQNEKPNLLLLGPAGLGKTFLLNCISLAVLERGFTVLRLSAFQMFELMRKYHRGQDEGGMETMLQAQLLALDDLGTGTHDAKHHEGIPLHPVVRKKKPPPGHANGQQPGRGRPTAALRGKGPVPADGQVGHRDHPFHRQGPAAGAGR